MSDFYDIINIISNYIILYESTQFNKSYLTWQIWNKLNE
jgi:hypothetical protein